MAKLTVKLTRSLPSKNKANQLTRLTNKPEVDPGQHKPKIGLSKILKLLEIALYSYQKCQFSSSSYFKRLKGFLLIAHSYSHL